MKAYTNESYRCNISASGSVTGLLNFSKRDILNAEPDELNFTLIPGKRMQRVKSSAHAAA